MGVFVSLLCSSSPGSCFRHVVPEDSLVWGSLPVCPEGVMKHVQVHDLWAAEHSSLSAQLTSESRASAAFYPLVLSLSRNDLPLCGKQCPLMCQHHSEPLNDFSIINTFVLSLSLCTQASNSFALSFPWGL